MQKTGKYNSLFVFVLTGFGIGLLLFFFYYWGIYNATDSVFDINSFFKFHSTSPISWLFDLIPFVGIFLSWVFYNSFSRQNEKTINKMRTYESQNREAIKIARTIAKGELSTSFEKDNELMQSLSYLQESLKEKQKLELQREEENRIRNWSTEGMAKFGSILREKSNNLEELSYSLISELVKYLDANQGGFFVKEEEGDKKLLNLLACHAYDRKKFADKKIPWNEGVIGSVAMEKKPFYTSDIPDDYLEITSGLGKANPGYLLLTPLVHNEDVKGIIEIASFTEMKKYEIEFVEQVAEIIAMTLENISNSLRTEKLLKETRTQAQKLALQEEKARQNMDELKSIQEQAARQAEKFISFSTTVNHTLIRAEYDVNGILLYANTKFIRKLGYSGNREVEGKHISMFIDEKDREWFNNIWESLSLGGAHFEGYMKHITKNMQELWTMATYTCMRKEDGNVEKVLFLAIDTTEQKKQSMDYESQIEALDRLNVKAEFSPDGKLLSSNKLFLNAFKFSEIELQNKTIYDFLDRKDIENFSESWEKMIQGHAFQSQIRMITKFQEEKWFRANFTSVNDMYGEVSKVIFLGNEITNEKLMENESRLQNESLKKQEEKFRLENLNLNRNVQELKEKIDKEKQNYEVILHSYQKLLEYGNSMNIIFDNSGEILYLSNSMIRFYDIDPEIKPFTTEELLDLIKKNRKTDFIINLLDPAKPKNITEKSIVLKSSEEKDAKFHLHFHSKDSNEKRIYLASFQTI